MKPYQTGEPNRRLFHVTQVEDLVPEDHLLRRIAAAADFTFIRALVQETYNLESDCGRPPWDPMLLLKMMFLGFLFNLSDNRLEPEVRMHAGYRWSLGLDFEDPCRTEPP